MTGTLYGVGVGPGDPELVTLKAARLIAAAGAVVYPAPEGGDSLARGIAAGLIRPGTAEIAISLPMTTARGPAQAAYDAAADRIARRLDSGLDVVVLCEGDPFFYGSFMYLHARLAPRFAVEVVPGVTSLTAAAARAGVPLAARNGVVTVLPAPLPDADLAAGIAAAETVAILKLGRHLGRVREVLRRGGWLDRAVYVERATQAGERVLPMAEAPDPAPYFALALVTKGGDPWL